MVKSLADSFMKWCYDGVGMEILVQPYFKISLL